MSTGLRWTLVGVAALALHAGSGATAIAFPSCDRANFGDDARWPFRAIKDSGGRGGLEDLRGRDRLKALVLERLRRTNQAPLADLELGLVLPRRVDLDASGSSDEDGFPEFYAFRLFDDDTGELLAGPLTTREPHASLDVEQDLPANLRASVLVEDDEGAIDTTELTFSLGVTSCSTAFFHCVDQDFGPNTTCTLAPGVEEFSTADLSEAADQCNASTTTVVITAAGGAGGRSANEFPFQGAPGGAGGAARLATTIADLDSTYGSPSEGTTYCFGLGSAGGDTCTTAGAGGASTLLRTCQNVSQTDTTGVLLIGGGGGGSYAARSSVAISDLPDANPAAGYLQFTLRP